jgi:predicted regulator of Ras-like GTPase activity (Roadblock/LC7/MglB family)
MTIKKPDAVGHEEHSVLQMLCDQLASESGVKLAFLIHTNGQILVSSGQLKDVDLTGFAALAAGNMAGALGLAKLVKEASFSTLVYEGTRDLILVCGIDAHAILVVHVDRDKTLGWVRFQARRRLSDMAFALDSLMKKYATQKSPLHDFLDEEIENLNFGGL